MQKTNPACLPLEGMGEGRTSMARSVKAPLSVLAVLVLTLVISLTVAVGVAFAEAAYTVSVSATAANPDTGKAEGTDGSANIGAQGLYEIDANNDKFLTVRIAKASSIKDVIVSFDTTKKGTFGQRYYAEETAKNSQSNSVDYRFCFPSEAATIKMEVEDTQGGSTICFIKISNAKAGNAGGFKQTVQSQSTGSSASQGTGSSAASSASRPTGSSAASGSGTGTGSSSAAQGSSAAAAQGNSGATGGTAGSSAASGGSAAGSAAGTGAGSSAAAQGTGTGTNETNPSAANGSGPTVTDATGAGAANGAAATGADASTTAATGTDGQGPSVADADDSQITDIAEQVFGSKSPSTEGDGVDGAAFPDNEGSQASTRSNGPNPGLVAGIIIAIAAIAAAAAYFVYMRPKRKARQAQAEAAFQNMVEGAAAEAAAAEAAPSAPASDAATAAAAGAGVAGAAAAAAGAPTEAIPASTPASETPKPRPAGAHRKKPAPDLGPEPDRVNGAIPLGSVSDPNNTFDLE